MADGPPQTSEDLALVLKDLEQRTERLKQLYEQYFMGIERIEPLVARKDVTRTMLTLQQQYIRNTALRFKFNTMMQKWSLYTTYWNRTLREIEKGTYVRHLQKAARQAEKHGSKLPSEMRVRGIARHAETAEAEQAVPAAPAAVIKPAAPAAPVASAKPGAPAVPPSSARAGQPPPLPPGARGTAPPPVPAAAARAPTPPTGSAPHIPGMSEGELRALHQRYQEARTASGDKGTVRYETLVASLAKQVPNVLGRPGVKGVRFDVEVKDGKPILKAFPKK